MLWFPFLYSHAIRTCTDGEGKQQAITMGFSPFSKFGRYSTALPVSYGKTFFVHSSGTGAYQRIADRFGFDEDGVNRVFTTIAAAVAVCTASQGDTIYVLEGHTETLTAALTLSVAGISVIGLGTGKLRPTLTGNGAIDAVDITAANVTFENFAFAAPGTDNQTAMINVAAAGATIRKIYGIGSTTAKNVVDCITIAATADDCTIEDVQLYNTTVAVNSFISIEAAVARLSLINVRCFGDVVAGGLIDAAAATHLFMEDVRIAVVGTTKPAATLDSNPTGMARNCFFSGTSTTLAANGDLGNAMRVDNIKVLEETNNSASAAIIPAVDAD